MARTRIHQVLLNLHIDRLASGDGDMAHVLLIAGGAFRHAGLLSYRRGNGYLPIVYMSLSLTAYMLSARCCHGFVGCLSRILRSRLVVAQTLTYNACGSLARKTRMCSWLATHKNHKITYKMRPKHGVRTHAALCARPGRDARCW